MKTKLHLLLVCLGLLLGFAACSRQAPPAGSDVVSIDLQQEWFPFAGFAGEISGAKRFAAGHGLRLQVRPGSEQVDPIKLVLSKTCPVGVVGGDLLIAAVAKGAPLVAIGVVNERSPTVFIVGDQSPIRGPADFRGRKVGVLAGTNTERIYELMMKRAGVERTAVQEIQIPFDLQTYLLGEYEVRPAFIYDETVSLEQQGRSFRLIKPEEYGVNFTGTVYFTTREYLAQNRATVVRLLATLHDGWKFALENPGTAVDDLVAAYPDLNRAREKRALEMGRTYFANAQGRPLECNPEVWQRMIAGLEELTVIAAGKLKVGDVWDPTPLAEALQHEHKP